MGDEAANAKRRPRNKGVHWKFYMAAKDVFFLQMYNKGSTLREVPEELLHLQPQGPVGHTSYKGFGNKKGFITTYMLFTDPAEIIGAAKRNRKKFEIRQIDLDRNLDFVDRMHNIRSSHVNLEEYVQHFRMMTRHDVEEFCGRAAATEDLIIRHWKDADIIEHLPDFDLKNPGQYDLVKQGKGFYEKSQICLIDIGIDPLKGCISNVTPEGMYNPAGRCGYCYAGYKNGICATETIFNFDEQMLEERVNNLMEKQGIDENERVHFRIGQTVEAHMPSALRKLVGLKRDPLMIVLNYLAEFAKKRDIRVAFPTKTLEYSRKYAEKLRDANVALLGSVGFSELEKGMAAHGFPPEKRMQNMLHYARDGVNANIYIMTDITRGTDCWQPDAQAAYVFFEEHSDYLGLQFLDARITQKKHAKMIGGAEWHELLGPKKTGSAAQLDLFSRENQDNPRFGLTNTTFLHANFVHDDYLNMIGDNRGRVRLCYTHGPAKLQKCGKCFMD